MENKARLLLQDGRGKHAGNKTMSKARKRVQTEMLYCVRVETRRNGKGEMGEETRKGEEVYEKRCNEKTEMLECLSSK